MKMKLAMKPFEYGKIYKDQNGNEYKFINEKNNILLFENKAGFLIKLNKIIYCGTITGMSGLIRILSEPIRPIWDPEFDIEKIRNKRIKPILNNKGETYVQIYKKNKIK